ncbi:ABC-F family ATP-binding cassette domain-containing protein [Ornithinimicrobium pratense]|uniref:ABC-F family ATP-binding cassette domain-containing protein n=1 Tax=Ornithinimicrobium pratense TaxID=2593973 RepID=A0A5J6V5C3_9MICO|nr:ATP-binding cassette domain-containing protein [Ornithinimicrobium pratense]QFG68386.1 ABC-F family ATP-binding cassette domain-containing protein [Ornithinimicrobium pratense]
MGHVDLSQISFVLPDGRPLLDEVSLRVGEGAVVALVGPNGTGKTTLLRIIAGDLEPHGGSLNRSGGLGVMRQFIGSVRDDSTVRDLLVSVAPERIGQAARALDATELAIMEVDDEPAQMAYAQALADWGDVGGYEQETRWDEVTTTALGLPFEQAQWRRVRTLSGGEQKRLVLEALLRGPEEVLLLDEPDNYLDVPGKQWLESALQATTKTVLLVSHDRELLSRAATRIVTLEPSAAGATAWTHPGSFATWHQARRERNARLEEELKRWDEEHAKLRRLMLMYKQKAAYNSDMAARYQAARTRLQRFEDAGPPEKIALEQNVRMRLTGGRTAKRAVVCRRLELLAPGEGTGEALMRPFDLEVWYGERVAVLGSNGSGKSHFLRLLAAGGSDPDVEHQPIGAASGGPTPVRHTGVARLGSRVRPGWFAQTHEGLQTGEAGRTLLQILHRGDEHRHGRTREEAARVLDRYGLARAAEQTFESLSGGQQARFQILLLELSGATLLLLDEPTDNLDLHSAEALEEGLAGFEGTVLAVTHDRWFARGFDRFLVFGAGGTVYEADEPVWDEARVRRQR